MKKSLIILGLVLVWSMSLVYAVTCTSDDECDVGYVCVDSSCIINSSESSAVEEPTCYVAMCS